jgi:hypothetical protein
METNRAEYKITGSTVAGNVVQSGYQLPLNLHTAEGKANVLVALDQMQETFPNLEWVGVVANWFGTSTDVTTCDIWPCVEYQANTLTTPDDWQVAGFTRASARQIGNEQGDSINFTASGSMERKYFMGIEGRFSF